MCVCVRIELSHKPEVSGCIGHQIKPWMCYTSVLDQYWYLTNKSQQKYIQSKFFQTSCIFVSNTILNILIVRSLPSWQRKGISPFMRWQYHGFLYKEAEQQQLWYWPRLCGMIVAWYADTDDMEAVETLRRIYSSGKLFTGKEILI